MSKQIASALITLRAYTEQISKRVLIGVAPTGSISARGEAHFPEKGTPILFADQEEVNLDFFVEDTPQYDYQKFSIGQNNLESICFPECLVTMALCWYP